MRDQVVLQSCLDGNTTCDDAYTNVPAGFTVSHSSQSNTIIGFSTSGAIIPAGCGIVFTLYHTPTDFEYWNYSNFISDLVFTDDDLSNFDPSNGVYYPSTIETCFNFTNIP